MTTTAPTPIILTLDSQSVLSNPIDIIAYVLRYYLTAPKSVSDTTYAAMISFADTASRYQDNLNVTAQSVITDLSAVFNRFFNATNNGGSSIDVTPTDNGDGTYNLTIAITVSVQGRSYALGADVSIDNTGVLAIKYHPSF